MPHGKICYIEIAAGDAGISSAFYARLFGWNLRTRGDGSIAFDDATGAVSGTWVTDPSRGHDAAMLMYVMVDSIDETLGDVAAAGGEVLTPYTALGGGAGFAIVKDPGGNRLGLYEQRG